MTQRKHGCHAFMALLLDASAGICVERARKKANSPVLQKRAKKLLLPSPVAAAVRGLNGSACFLEKA